MAPSGLSNASKQNGSDQRWELVKRIASSNVFRKSPRLRQFLLFVGERSVQGRVDEIGEYEIAWKLFERGPDHNPGDDSIVRSTARQLRSKVKEYFETEGLDESLILDIPKGSYVPVFFKREHLASPLNLTQPPSAVTEDREAELWRWKILTAALLAVIMFLTAFGQWERPVIAPRTKSNGTVVSTILKSDQATRIVLSDAGLASISGATRHLLSAAEYANHSYPTLAVGSALQPVWDKLGDGTMTYFPEVRIASSIMKLGDEEGKNIAILTSRQISAQDLRSGNLVVIGNPSGCPWIHLIEDKLNFRYRRTFNSSGGEYEFRNLRPQPGEEVSYSVGASVPQYGRSFAILARVPNLSNDGTILLISGFKTPGIQAAGEYATDPRAATELTRIFGVASIRDLPNFEVLLSTDSMAKTPLNVHVVAHRIVR